MYCLHHLGWWNEDTSAREEVWGKETGNVKVAKADPYVGMIQFLDVREIDAILSFDLTWT
jgi:hypothetical protein